MKTLVDGTLKVTPPSGFNDPFEFSPGIDPDLARKTPPTDRLRDLFLAPGGLLRAMLFEKHGSGNESGYRNWIETVALQHLELLPTVLQNARHSLVEKMSKMHGVACFSEFSEADLQSPEVVRHWANYADDHHGMAIEFDGGHEFFRPWSTEWGIRVSYVPVRPFFCFSDLEDFTAEGLLEKLRRWAKVKSKQAWGTESEWRLIVPLGEPIPKMPLRHVMDGERTLHLVHLWRSDAPAEERRQAAQVIRRVILGSRASPELEASVQIARAQPHLRHVLLDRAQESLSSFSMKLVHIS